MDQQIRNSNSNEALAMNLQQFLEERLSTVVLLKTRWRAMGAKAMETGTEAARADRLLDF